MGAIHARTQSGTIPTAKFRRPARDAEAAPTVQRPAGTQGKAFATTAVGEKRLHLAWSARAEMSGQGIMCPRHICNPHPAAQLCGSGSLGPKPEGGAARQHIATLSGTNGIRPPATVRNPERRPELDIRVSHCRCFHLGIFPPTCRSITMVMPAYIGIMMLMLGIISLMPRHHQPGARHPNDDAQGMPRNPSDDA